MNSNNITINLENVSEENMKKLKAVLEDIEQDNCKWVDEPEQAFADRYYYIDVNGEIGSRTYRDDEYDYERFKIGNIFKTKEEAKFTLEKRKIIEKLKRYSKWCWEQFGISEKEAWEVGSANKCYIYYDYGTGKVFMEYAVNFKEMGNIYFPTEENARKAIEIIGEENLKKYVFGVEA